MQIFRLTNRWKSHLKGIRGAIRYRQWKLHTGIGSKKDEDKKSGWEIAPGREEGFIAFDDDYEDMTGKYYDTKQIFYQIKVVHYQLIQ